MSVVARGFESSACFIESREVCRKKPVRTAPAPEFLSQNSFGATRESFRCGASTSSYPAPPALSSWRELPVRIHHCVPQFEKSRGPDPRRSLRSEEHTSEL